MEMSNCPDVVGHTFSVTVGGGGGGKLDDGVGSGGIAKDEEDEADVDWVTDGPLEDVVAPKEAGREVRDATDAADGDEEVFDVRKKEAGDIDDKGAELINDWEEAELVDGREAEESDDVETEPDG